MSTARPSRVFLEEGTPFLFRVAAWFDASFAGRCLDLSAFAVLVPTAGAARRLRGELVRRAAATSRALLPPFLTTPMGLLARSFTGSIASPAEVLAAWSAVILKAGPLEYPSLLGGFGDTLRSRAALRVAQSLADVCSLLAEAGLRPSAPEIPAAVPFEEDRWRELAALHARYLRHLGRAGLADPNEASLAAAASAQPPPGIAHVVVAGVPDLNRLLESCLARLPVPVTLLVDAAGCAETSFDAWGRPDPASWASALLPIPLADIHVSAEPGAEAETAATLLGHAGLCVADPASQPALRQAFESRGRPVFDPAGMPLARFECAAVSRLWLAFCREGELAGLRALLEHPVFLRAFCREAHLDASMALALLDRLRSDHLLSTLPDALAYFRDRPDPAGTLVFAADRLRRVHDTSESLAPLSSFLEWLYAGIPLDTSSPAAEALQALAGSLRALLDSPLAAPDIAEEVFRSQLDAISIYGRHEEDAVELNGWLEAAWLPHDALVITGGVEGALPAAVSSHPFLPDALRARLGLQDNARRLARDIYLARALLASRRALKFTLPRVGADGEPARPSRLFFRCLEEDLPARVRRLFHPAPALRRAPARSALWSLSPPLLPPPRALGVTSFGDYLDCPLRFYFKHVVRMEEVDPFKAEMDARDFGTVLHNTVEAFSRDAEARDSSRAPLVEKFVLDALDAEMARLFGRHLSLPVQVQRESLRARLRRFARLQAGERAQGWRIVETEFAFKKDDSPLCFGGLAVTGRIDRIEINQRTGQRRILDYKTYKSASGNRPEQTHFERHEPDPDFPEACFSWDDRPRRWKQLQLPLYRALAALRWPDDPLPPLVGYFLLPEKIEESAIFDLELDEPLFASALRCAEAVAARVQRGVFFPPREVRYESYAGLFLGENPATLFGGEALAFFQGSPA